VDGRVSFPEKSSKIAASLGCSLSHIAALESADWQQIDALIICEDDLEIVGSKEAFWGAIEEFLADPNLDVLAIYGRVRGVGLPISNQLKVASGIVGAVSYVVKPHMSDPLRKAFTKGLKYLEQGKRKGSVDQMWQKLQSRRYLFATPISQIVRNREGTSDIEGRFLEAR
jgi:hypothetical protein